LKIDVFIVFVDYAHRAAILISVLHIDPYTLASYQIRQNALGRLAIWLLVLRRINSMKANFVLLF
jgi:hypothetical protein